MKKGGFLNWDDVDKDCDHDLSFMGYTIGGNGYEDYLIATYMCSKCGEIIVKNDGAFGI